MTNGRGEAAGDRAPVDAAGWFARMRGPDAARWTDGLAIWRAESPENDAAYARLLQRWDQAAFLTNTSLGRARDLGLAAIWYRRPAVRYVALAASLLLVAGVGMLTMRRTGVPGKLAPILEYASNDQAVRTIAFADGTRVTLDAGAAITVDDTAGRRRVQLVRGRARFDVTSSAAPLAIATENHAVIAGEGQFDVGLEGRLVRVVAWRGSLDLSGPGIRPVRLMAGQRAVFDRARGVPSLARADPGELGWTRGMLSFDRARLADAVAAINRYNRIRIELLDPELAEFRITGAFRASDPGGFAHAVAEMFHLSLDASPGGSIILGREKKA
jgi:transmembrane sensor